MKNFRGAEGGRGAGEVDGKGRIIGPAHPPWSPKVAENMYEYLQTHIEVLKLCITLLARVQINNNNYEQTIAFFVIILVNNTFKNQNGIIYCWRQV